MTTLDRARLLAQAQNLIDNKNFTREDSARVDSILRLADALTPPAVKDELRRGKMALNEDRINPQPRVFDPASDYDRLFEQYVRTGSKTIADELRTVSYTPQSTTTTGGGYLIPQGFTNAVLEVARQNDALYAAATLVPTPRGNAFNHPVLDDDSEAQIVNENSEAFDGHTVFHLVAWGKCPRWSSGWAKVPLELIQDSLYDLPGVLSRLFGARIARGVGKRFITTLLSTATSAFTSASSTALTSDEVLRLMTSVDPIYAQRGSFLMNFTTYLAVSQLKGSTSGDYCFPVQVDSTGTPLIAGRPVLICPSMANLVSQAQPIAYGDCGQFLKREVTNSLTLRVATEQWIESAQYGYQLEYRCDGQLLTSADPSDPSPAMHYITMKT